MSYHLTRKLSSCRGRTPDSFNAIQRLFCERSTNEGGVRFHAYSYIAMPGVYLGARECRRRGCDAITECEHRAFLIAASGCLMNFLHPYFPPLYNFIATVEISFVFLARSLILFQSVGINLRARSQFVDDKWCVYFKSSLFTIFHSAIIMRQKSPGRFTERLSEMFIILSRKRDRSGVTGLVS